MNRTEFLGKYVPGSLVVLLYRESGTWVGHCLNFDLVEPGASMEDALDEVIRVTIRHIEYSYRHNRPQDLTQPAPKDLWARVPKAKPLPARTIHLALMKQAPGRPPLLACSYKAEGYSRKAAQVSSEHPPVSLHDAEKAFHGFGVEIRYQDGGDMLWGKKDGTGLLQRVGHKAAKRGLNWSQIKAICRKTGVDPGEFRKRL